jgi:transcriptional regulator
MVFRKHLLDILTIAPRSASSIARELGLKRDDVEEDLRHVIRTARAAGHRVVVEPARCRACGFLFAEEKLGKPGKCPACRSTWLFEAQVSVAPSEDG